MEAGMPTNTRKAVIDAFASTLLDMGLGSYKYDQTKQRLLTHCWALACETLDYDSESRIIIRRAIHPLQSDGTKLGELADDVRIYTAEEAEPLEAANSNYNYGHE